MPTSWNLENISLVLFHPIHYTCISLSTHPSDPAAPPIHTQLSPWKGPPSGERGLNIGGDRKRGSGGMATALSPSLLLAILFLFFPIRDSGARLDITQPDWPRLPIGFVKAERHLIKQLLIKPDQIKSNQIKSLVYCSFCSQKTELYDTLHAAIYILIRFIDWQDIDI